MPRAFQRPVGSWTYVLERDRDLPPDQQSRFTLSPMSHAERAAARDNLTREQIVADGSKFVIERTRQEAFTIALDHIEGAENFPVGAPLPWPESRAGRAKMLELLEDADVLEIGDAIFARSTTRTDTEENRQLGNSSPPGPTSSSGGSSAAGRSTTAPPAAETPG